MFLKHSEFFIDAITLQFDQRMEQSPEKTWVCLSISYITLLTWEALLQFTFYSAKNVLFCPISGM